MKSDFSRLKNDSKDNTMLPKQSRSWNYKFATSALDTLIYTSKFSVSKNTSPPPTQMARTIVKGKLSGERRSPMECSYTDPRYIKVSNKHGSHLFGV